MDPSYEGEGNMQCALWQDCLYNQGVPAFSYWSGFPVLVIFLSLVQEAVLRWAVHGARRRYGIPYPNMYAIPGIKFHDPLAKDAKGAPQGNPTDERIAVEDVAVGLRGGVVRDENADRFNCVQRAHQNHHEQLPFFLTFMFLGIFSFPLPAAIIGLVWMLGRQIYANCYYQSPEKRMFGFLHSLAKWALGALMIAFMVYLFTRMAPYKHELAGETGHTEYKAGPWAARGVYYGQPSTAFDGRWDGQRLAEEASGFGSQLQHGVQNVVNGARNAVGA